MAQPQKETILGNYTSFPRFPLDCESMDYIQNNTKLLAVIAQIAGCDKLIIKGCTGSPRTEGYVYVRTGDDLVGEILYYGGGTGVRCSIATDNINIDTTANGETFANAYTKRMLVSGTTGTWAWNEFRSLSEITNAALKAAVDSKAAASHPHAISDVTGLQSALDGKAASNHTHNYSAPGHTHDDRYYTESEINTKLSGKSDINHTHNYSAPGHTHDDRYYTEAEVDTKTAALQSAINAKQDPLSTMLIYRNSDQTIIAYRYGRVITVHVNGVETSTNNRVAMSVARFPQEYYPTQTIWAISIQSNSMHIVNTLDNLHIAWLQKAQNSNYLELGIVKSSNDPASIHATFTYVLN